MALQCTRLEDRDCPAVTVQLDYTYDSAGFFADPARRSLLQAVADSITGNFNDSLAAIVPNAGNTWTAGFVNPITNEPVTLTNPVIPANTLIVFVAGGPLGSNELGIAAGGSYSARGSSAWLNLVANRGQAEGSDTGPWGGFIGFDTGTQWYFGTGTPAGNQFDFAGVAAHELLHILGFGLGAPSYDRWTTTGNFTGPNSQAVFGSPVPLDPSDRDHWNANVRIGGVMPLMVPSIPAGMAREVTNLDYAALADIGWQVGTVPPAPPVVPPPPPPPTTIAPRGSVRFAVSADAGAASTVSAIDSAGSFLWVNQPFDANFTGGVRVASADFNRDGTEDVAVGTGPGAATQVVILDGRTQAILFSVSPFEPSFLGGVYLAAGDFTGDGRAELVITPDEGGGPRVDIYSPSGILSSISGFNRTVSFFGIDDPNFRGGARASTGDFTGDGRDDLIVAAGFGGGPRVAGFNGTSLRSNTTPIKIFADFFAFEQSLRNGIFVTAGDINGDGLAELIAGGGPGGGPRILAFDGGSLRTNQYVQVANFFAGDPNNRGGIRVATANLDDDNLADLITGAGAGAGSRLTGYLGSAITTAALSTGFDFDFYPGFGGGIFVG
jgi:hypothetical protein